MKKFVQYFYIILLINHSQADKAKLLDKQHKLTITCVETEDCIKELGPGYNCTNFSCECYDDVVCVNKVHTPKTSALINVIDEQCKKDDVCKVADSVCNEGYCRCIGGKVASGDKRKCLQVSGGLGEHCLEDIQCISKEPNSVCRNNKCVCNDIHNQDKYTCVRKIPLNGKCSKSVECSHIPASICGPIYCECEQGYAPSENKEQCLPVAKTADAICEENVQCRQLYGDIGICKNNYCVCDGGHSSQNEYHELCPTKLKTFCLDDEDCKMHADDFSMQCLRDRCECSTLFEEIDGTCNGGDMMNHARNIPILIFIFYIIMNFIK